MTESFDEDNQKAGSRTNIRQTVLVRRGVQLAAVAAVVVLYYQLMPGGLLSETSLGQAVQNLARAVARLVATVCLLLDLIDRAFSCRAFGPYVLQQSEDRKDGDQDSC